MFHNFTDCWLLRSLIWNHPFDGFITRRITTGACGENNEIDQEKRHKN